MGHFSSSTKGKKQLGGKPEVDLLLKRAQVLSLGKGPPLWALCMLVLQ